MSTQVPQAEVKPRTQPRSRQEDSGGRKRRGPSHVFVGLGIIIVGAATLVAWQLAASRGLVNAAFSGEPTRIVQQLIDGVSGTLITVDAKYTLLATLVGFSVATVLGIVAAFVLGQFSYARKILSPYLTAANSLPRIALAPLFVIWLGIGLLSHIVMAASLTFFVVYANTMAGIESVDPDHLLLARLQGAGRVQTFVKFIVPSALPNMFVGLELGFIFGMLGTVAGEMIAGTHGLGVRLQAQAGIFDTNGYFATLFVLAVITTIIAQVFQLLKLRLLRWQV